jgi:hypothetical protein
VLETERRSEAMLIEAQKNAEAILIKAKAERETTEAQPAGQTRCPHQGFSDGLRVPLVVHR